MQPTSKTWILPCRFRKKFPHIWFSSFEPLRTVWTSCTRYDPVVSVLHSWSLYYTNEVAIIFCTNLTSPLLCSTMQCRARGEHKKSIWVGNELIKALYIRLHDGLQTKACPLSHHSPPVSITAYHSPHLTLVSGSLGSHNYASSLT